LRLGRVEGGEDGDWSAPEHGANGGGAWDVRERVRFAKTHLTILVAANLSLRATFKRRFKSHSFLCLKQDIKWGKESEKEIQIKKCTVECVCKSLEEGNRAESDVLLLGRG
jgi:hypothetical protein